jgi:hypothetical protein
METTLKITRGNKRFPFPVRLRIDEDRIWFMRQPFSKILNAEIKSMAGYKWHGFQDPPVKKWSIKHCPRNVLRLRNLMGENIFEHFDQPLVDTPTFDRPEYDYYGIEPNGAQVDMIRRGLTYHYQIWAAEQGLGKSLASIELMERSGKKNWWFVGPKSALASVKREFKKWNVDDSIRLTTMTYEGLTSKIRFDFEEIKENCPDGVIFDESDNLKTATAKRTEAGQCIADLIREQHGMDGYVILMSGTPSAKHPTDWWAQCEIAWPGYLREGSFTAFEHRYAIIEEQEDMDGVKFYPRTGWKEEEVTQLPNRYSGLATVYRKAEWLPDLPPKTYRTVRMIPSNKVLRVSRSLVNIAPNTITALTWLRALSSGFQYVNKEVDPKQCPVCKGAKVYDHPEEDVCPCCLGEGEIPDYEREARQVHTPKDDALRDELDKCETHGRIVVAASFQGSIDRILKICKERGWAVACVDGRGWRAYDAMGNTIKEIEPLDLWEQHEGKVAFVGNPGSCRYGLTLTLAHTLVFYDNNFSAVQRLQMEDRIHRQSMGEFANIVDFIHLEVDQLVVDTLKANKKLELLSLGAINETVGLDSDDDLSEEILLD